MLYIVLLFLLFLLFTIKFHKDCDLDRYGLSNMLNIRGILTILIIFHHLASNQGLVLPNKHPFYILPHLGYLCVGVFFLLSGYGIECKANINKMYKNTLLTKSTYLVIIYIIYNFIYFIVYPLYGNGGGFSQLILGFINGNPLAGSSWFLLALSLLYMSVYISRNLKHDFGGMLAVQFIVFTILKFMDFRAIWYYSSFCFPLGMLFRKYQHLLIRNIVRKTSLLVAGLILGSLFLFSTNVNGPLEIVCKNLSAMSFSAIIMIACLNITFKRNLGGCIGKYSLEIFLIHVLVYKVLRGNYIYISNDFIYSAIVVIGSLFFALPLSKIDKYIKRII